jgi:phage FluMu protein Com
MKENRCDKCGDLLNRIELKILERECFKCFRYWVKLKRYQIERIRESENE